MACAPPPATSPPGSTDASPACGQYRHAHRAGRQCQPDRIVKTPRSGPVLIDTLGLLGDAVLDRKHHGGPDQAVYVYLQSDYDLWTQDLGEPLPPGTFGENLVIDGIAGDTLAIGDRFVIGPVTLEVTYHRTPATLWRAAWATPAGSSVSPAPFAPAPIAASSPPAQSRPAWRSN